MRHLFLLLSLLVGTAYAQSFSYPTIKGVGKSINDFIPPGWHILDTAFGNLNKDAAADAALVIQHTDSIPVITEWEDTISTQPRILLVIFKNPSENVYRLLEQHNSFILMHDNPSMTNPFEKLSIQKGILDISFHLFHTMGSWYTTNAGYKFRYQQGELVLIGANIYTLHRATLDYENYSCNFLTGKRVLTAGNEAKGTKNTTWKSLNLPRPKTLSSLGKPFAWEVEPDRFL